MKTIPALTLPLHGLRAWFLQRFFQWMYARYRRYYHTRRPAWSVGRAELRRRPPGSLGRALAGFLDEQGQELMPRFENHDVFHVIAGYGATVPEEITLQFFLLANGKRSVNVFGTVLLGTLVFPEHWGAFHEAYRRGRQALPFHRWYFEYLLEEPLDRLRAHIFQKDLNDDPFTQIF